MNIDLARRFMNHYIPADGQIEVNQVWNFMKTNPIDLLTNGLMFTQLNGLRTDPKALAVAKVQAFVTGFALAYCLKFPEIEGALERACAEMDKMAGGNVVNFLDRKKSL